MAKHNLPDSFPVDSLSNFDFGSVDAFRDQLLSDTFCFTNAAKISRNRNKSFIIGPPGSGKSALFKAYKSGYIQPKYNHENRYFVIGISDELRYIDIDRVIAEKFGYTSYPEEDKYVLLWDTYFLFKIITKLKDEGTFRAKRELIELAKIFDKLQLNNRSTFESFLKRIGELSVNIKCKLGDILVSSKTTTGNKLGLFTVDPKV